MTDIRRSIFQTIGYSAFLLTTAALSGGQTVWTGEGTSWSEERSWNAGVPSSSVRAEFATDAPAVEVPETAAAQGIVVRGTATGGVRFKAAADDAQTHKLTIGTGGIVVEEGAGPILFEGIQTGDRPVSVTTTGAQYWKHEADSPVILAGGLSLGANLTLSNGVFHLGGVIQPANSYVDLSGTTNSALHLLDGLSASKYQLSLSGINLFVDGAPLRIPSLFKFGNGTTILSGDGPMIFTGGDDGTSPSIIFSQYRNQPLQIRRSGTVDFLAPVALCSSPTGPNNGTIGLMAGSGSQIVLHQGFWDTATGSYDKDTSSAYNRGAKLCFDGVAANYTLIGDSPHGWRTSGTHAATSIVHDKSGPNFVSLSAGDGPKTFGPFGRGMLRTNNGQTTFFRALEPDLVITNGLGADASTGNDGGRPYGFASSYDMTFAGGIDVRSPAMPIASLNMGEGDISFGGEIRLGGKSDSTWTLEQGGYRFLSDSIFTGTNNYGMLRLYPSRPSVISGRSESMGMLDLGGGSTIELDYASNPSGKFPVSTNNTSALRLSGADLLLAGGSGLVDSVAADSGTLLRAGRNSISRKDGEAIVDLGTLAIGSPSAGTLDVQSGVVKVRDTGDRTSLVLNRGYFTVDRSAWAAVDPDGFLVPLSGEVPFAEAVPGDYAVLTESCTLTGGSNFDIQALRVQADTEDIVLDIGERSGLILRQNGTLVTGTHDVTIRGTSLQPILTSGDYTMGLSFLNYGSGVLTLDAPLKSGFLILGGTGPIRILATNQVNGGSYLNRGRILFGANGILSAASNLTLNGATLVSECDSVLSNKITLSTGGCVFEIPEGTTLEVRGTITGSTGSLRSEGAGTLVLSGDSTFQVPVYLNNGTVRLGSATALGLDSSAKARLSTPVFLNGTTLDLAGLSPNISFIRLEGGAKIVDSVGGGSLTGFAYDLRDGIVDVPLNDLTASIYKRPEHPVPLFKRGPGDVHVLQSLSHSGLTCIEEGRLFVDGDLANSPVHVKGGAFYSSGNLGGSLNVEAGRIVLGLDPVTDASYSTMVVAGGGIGLGRAAVVRISVNGESNGGFAVTHPYARISIDQATLDLQRTRDAGSRLLAGVCLIRNDGLYPVSGEFEGFPESVEQPIGNGNTLVMTYQGGDGNDVVLTMISHTSILFVR